jgi:hypothetical protein
MADAYAAKLSVRSKQTGKFGFIIKILDAMNCEVIFDGDRMPVLCTKDTLILGVMRSQK